MGLLTVGTLLSVCQLRSILLGLVTTEGGLMSARGVVTGLALRLVSLRVAVRLLRLGARVLRLHRRVLRLHRRVLGLSCCSAVLRRQPHA